MFTLQREGGGGGGGGEIIDVKTELILWCSYVSHNARPSERLGQS